MAKLYFRYGAMNSGKSTDLLQVAHNYRERGMRPVILKPEVDTKSPEVLSRLNVSAKVDWAVEPDESILDLYSEDVKKEDKPIGCVLVDEAQFLTPQQVDELFILVSLYNIPVLAFGLRTDFRAQFFPGSRRLFELAHSLEELKTICSCGAKATFNARLINGEFVQEGETVAIDGQDATYESLCGKCYLQKVGRIHAHY